MPTGKVKFFNDSKGFGFIVNDDTQKDIFVHVSGLAHEVKEGDAVSFDEQEGKRGMNAVNVRAL